MKGPLLHIVVGIAAFAAAFLVYGALSQSRPPEIPVRPTELPVIPVTIPQEGPFIYGGSSKYENVWTMHEKKLNVWYLGKKGQSARVEDFKNIGDGAQVTWFGYPAVLIRLEEQNFTSIEGTEQGFVAFWATDTHVCCRVDWRLTRPEELNLLWDICHDERYDPRQIVEEKYRGFSYRGAKPAGGPAERALPQIPIKIKDGVIFGVADRVHWYEYC